MGIGCIALYLSHQLMHIRSLLCNTIFMIDKKICCKFSRKGHQYVKLLDAKKERLEAKRQSDGWLNNEVGFESICHESRGNLIDGLGNPIKEVEDEVVDEEEKQDRNEELRLR
jgi:hypothetical protein